VGERVGHVAHTGSEKIMQVSVGHPQGKALLKTSKCRMKEKVKMGFRRDRVHILGLD
jgi:hypothetical protein